MQPMAAPSEPPVILVVDDEPDLEQLLSLKFRRKIRKGEICFHFAHDGVEALGQLEAHPDIEVVITDINMPNMDGLSLVMKLREAHPMVKAVIVSAYGDMGNIRGAMNRGAFDFLTKPLDFHDFEATVAKTVEHVRAIRDTIKSLEENRILKLFVDEAALHFMQKEREEARSESIDCSVAFIDICGFTSITERHGPVLVVELLNRCFEAIVQAIQPYGGAVDKFIGDAAMVLFQGEGHRRRAVQACLDSVDAIQAMRDELEQHLGFSPNVAIGINAGTVVLGPVGARSLGRLDFTVIGDVVNTAARLQGVAAPGEVVVTEEFVDGLGPTAVAKHLGVQTLKGKGEPLRLWAVTGLSDEEGVS